MSFRIHCNCGWTNQVSEFYLGDRITCPDCGEKIAVHQSSGVPYGYAPYPTWQKKLPVKRQPLVLPMPRKLRLPIEDPHASHAFWLGLGSMLLSISVCGFVPGVLMAVFGIYAALRSYAFCKDWKIRQTAAPRAGLLMSVIAVLISVTVFFSLADFGSTGCHKPPQPRSQQQRQVEIDHNWQQHIPNRETPQGGYRYEPIDTQEWGYNTKPGANEDVLDKVRRRMHEEDVRRAREQQAMPGYKAPQAPGYRYGNPEPKAPQAPGYRYGNPRPHVPSAPVVPIPGGYRYGK
ncbi:MAG: hypothetical protein KDB82_07020 [Planctomycetes bacterium]|nr:hypothetical protein [Planctomycetota bacterium]